MSMKHRCQDLNTNIIHPILVDAYKHLKILYAQSKVLQVGAYTCQKPCLPQSMNQQSLEFVRP
jgi:hypothetical protein